MKGRMSAHDVSAEVCLLQRSLLGLQVQNIYDITSKMFLFRVGSGEKKQSLLIETGVRLHLTEFDRTKPPTPSQFCIKLRKHLRGKRIENIEQFGVDRLVCISFGRPPTMFCLFLEFYASGNIILTDEDKLILAVHRRFVSEDGSTRVIAKNVYENNDYRRLIRYSAESVVFEVRKRLESRSDILNANVVDVLVSITGFSPVLVRDAIVNSSSSEAAEKLDISASIKDIDLNSEDDSSPWATCVAKALNEIVAKFEKLKATDESSRSQIVPGYLLCTGDPSKVTELPIPDIYTSQKDFSEFCEKIPSECMIEFSPSRISLGGEPKKENKWILEFSSFDSVMDVFFSRKEEKRAVSQVEIKKKKAAKQLKSVKGGYQSNIDSFKKSLDVNERKAELIVKREDLLNACINSINLLISQKRTWDEISSLVREAKRAGDEVAGCIRNMSLEKNTITVVLAEDEPSNDDDDEEDGENGDNEHTKKMPVVKKKQQQQNLLDIDIDLSCSVHANAQKYYGLRRKNKDKLVKAYAALPLVQKAAEKRSKSVLQKKDLHKGPSVARTRHPYWFEKFHWFISSENLIVVAGKEMIQNELIHRKYLEPNDIYIHPDVHGAPSTVIKMSAYIKSIGGKPGEFEMPPKVTLNEALTFAIARSKSWASKIPVNAYWVFGKQVSKTAPAGEYLTTGSFIIRGSKTYLRYPEALEMGVGFIFKVDRDSAIHVDDQEGEEKQHTKETESASDNDGNESNNNNEQGSSNTRGDPVDVEIEEEEVSKEEESDATIEVIGTLKSKSSYDKYVKEKQQKTLDSKKGTKKTVVDDSSSSSSSNIAGLGNTDNALVADTVTLESSSICDEKKRGNKRKSKKKARRRNDEGDDEEEIRLFERLKRLNMSEEKEEEEQGEDDCLQEPMQGEGESIISDNQSSQETDAPSNNEDHIRSCYHCGSPEHLKSECPIFAAESAAASKVREVERGGGGVAELTTSNFSISSILFSPTTEESIGGISCAIPMVGPWSSISRCRYSAKLVPGTMKAGNAARSFLTSCVGEKPPEEDEKSESGRSEEEKAAEREVSLIKSIAEDGFMSIMLPNVKIIHQSDGNNKSGPSKSGSNRNFGKAKGRGGPKGKRKTRQ